MSLTFLVLYVFTSDISQTEKRKQKKNELNASKFKIMYILFLSVDADIFSLLD